MSRKNYNLTPSTIEKLIKIGTQIKKAAKSMTNGEKECIIYLLRKETY